VERFDVDREPIQVLYDLYKKGRIELQPSYQRSRVWTDDLRYGLMDSINQEFPIGLVMLNVVPHIDEDNNKIDRYEVVDGQQRMRTILEYVDGSELWACSENIKSFVPFKKLSGAKQDRIKEYKIPVAKMKDFEQEEISECFNRLQEGKALKMGEKLKAMVTSPFYEFVQSISRHKIFTSNERLQVRDAHLALATAFLKSEYQDELFGRQEFVNLRSFLQTSADSMDASRAKKATERVQKVLNFEQRTLVEALQLNPQFVKYTNTARLIKWVYIALSILMDKYSISGRERSAAEGMLAYYQLIAKEGSDEWTTYVNAGRTGRVDTKEVKECLHQLVNHILIATQAEPLDAARYFTRGQRTTIFERSRGNCQASGCKTKISKTNFHADHVKPHSEGGRTVVENGVALCTRCNRLKGKDWRKDFGEAIPKVS
jgi:hypothetical protein